MNDAWKTIFLLIPFCHRNLQKLLNADHKSNFCRLLLVKCFWFAQHHLVTIINRKDSSSISRTPYDSKDWKTAYWRYRGFKLQLMCALASLLSMEKDFFNRSAGKTFNEMHTDYSSSSNEHLNLTGKHLPYPQNTFKQWEERNLNYRN